MCTQALHSLLLLLLLLLLFKVSLLTYKAIHEKQPVYLHSMLAASLLSRSLRSNRGISLSVSRVETNSGARAFHSCVPSFWNNLPLSVRSAISVAAFKKHLKTCVWPSFSPIVISTPDDQLMLRNCLIDFAFEHRFGLTCHWAWLAGDISAIEI